MAEYSQTYWNTLIEKYREGSISEQERYQLEKQAMDDPFLFDALEGFSMHNSDIEEAKKGGGNSRIFTIPRIAAAAIVFLVAAMFYLKSDSNLKQENDQAIAMVLDKDEKPAPIAKGQELEENANSKKQSTTTDKSEEGGAKPVENKTLPSANNKIQKEIKEAISTPPTSSTQSTLEEQTNWNAGNSKVTEAEVLDAPKIEKEEIVFTADQDNNTDVIDESAISQDSEDLVEIDNVANFESAKKEKNSGNAGIEESIEEVKAKKRKSGVKSYFEAVPVIGKEIFNDYSREKIDERGLRQEKPQEVTIEFSIDANGNLTNFHHIFTGCSECGPYAIYLLQNSGEWKTIPPGYSGKARYTFIF